MRHQDCIPDTFTFTACQHAYSSHSFTPHAYFLSAKGVESFTHSYTLTQTPLPSKIIHTKQSSSQRRWSTLQTNWKSRLIETPRMSIQPKAEKVLFDRPHNSSFFPLRARLVALAIWPMEICVLRVGSPSTAIESPSRMPQGPWTHGEGWKCGC